ncbi:type II toxin-antitoxin system RelE/ParE family toxin [Bradyrhizobium sp.]|uniref:type II toxin-antitoxin system RelE/ParE family toxin n=1 Tax=Bradyrhizobium sp. TaxID=376 RepID=UPI0025B8D873|nr:type II toxin-antitoxin system RelE/ParE family toxin [Bradyrhizobium sp.]
MPNKFRKLPQADLDLDSIWNFIAADDSRAADRLIDRIGKVFQMLVESPLAGRERSELGRDLRSFPIGNYVVFYVPTSDGIEVIRVMNGRQDISADDLA